SGGSPVSSPKIGRCEAIPRRNLFSAANLLKMPTCVAEVRRVILDQLGNRYGRRFDTHWDFVRYAQQHGLNLDFTTPPKRPDRKPPPLFEGVVSFSGRPRGGASADAPPRGRPLNSGRMRADMS
ncbi:MAG TPA: hypothetical protein VKA46_08465, partial [Gemmataceae bacterium]|nr:hypothetical protein [Gemmataceae bacterium]